MCMIDQAKCLVSTYYNSNHPDGEEYDIRPEQCKVVWFSKTLQNWKAIMIDGTANNLLYEVSHNGDKHETYLDVYRKVANICYGD